MKSVLLFAFVLVSFSAAACQPFSAELPVQIINLKAHVEANRQIISWSTDGTQPVNTFEVQRSTDGKTFTTVALVLGADSREQQELYKFPVKISSKEQQPTWYRVAHVNPDGTVEYSNSIALSK